MTHHIERLRFVTDHEGNRGAYGPRVTGYYEGTGVYTTPEDARSLDELEHAAEHSADDATRRAAAEEALRRLAARDLGLDDALRVERAGALVPVPADLAARAAVVGRAANSAGRSWHSVHACTEEHMVAWGRAGELAAEVAVGRAVEIPGSPGWYLRAPWTDGAARALLGLAA